MTLIISTWDNGEKTSTTTYENIKTISLISENYITIQNKQNQTHSIKIDIAATDITIVE